MMDTRPTAIGEALQREIMELRMCLDLQAPDDGTELKSAETNCDKAYTQWYASQFLKHDGHPEIPYLKIWRDAFRAASLTPVTAGAATGGRNAMSDKPLLPLKAYVEAHPHDEWRAKEEFVLHTSPRQRFRITRELGHSEALGDHGWLRTEKLIEQGVNPAEEDAKEFAQALMDSLFDHTTARQEQYILVALTEHLAERERRRESLRSPRNGRLPIGDHPFNQFGK